MKTLKNEYLTENKEFYININGLKHWCRIAGIENKTVPIVVIHGGPGGNNYTFERTIGLILEKFTTIIYYEQRGCGRSKVPEDKEEYSIPILISDLAKLCKELNLNKIIPLGYSFGGELALEFVLRYPNLVEKVIVQAPTVMCDNSRISYVQLYGFEQVGRGRIKKKIKNVIYSSPITNIDEKIIKIWEFVDVETIDRLLFRNAKFAKINRRLWENSGLINSGLMLKALQKQKNEVSLIERVSQTKVPTLILIGLYDRNVGVDLSRDFRDKIPNSQLVIFENSAHFPDIEESERYASTIKEFILN